MFFPFVHEQQQVVCAVAALRAAVLPFISGSKGRKKIFLAALRACLASWKSLNGPIGEAGNFLQFANDRGALQTTVRELFIPSSGFNTLEQWFKLGGAIAFGDPIEAHYGQPARSSERPIVWSVYQENLLNELANGLKLKLDTLLPQIELSPEVRCWLPYHPNTYFHWFRIEAGLKHLRQKTSPNSDLPQSSVTRQTKVRKPRASRDANLAKCVAALSTYHQYQNGGLSQWEPIGVRELSEMAKVTRSSASRFFKENFGGHEAYANQCFDRIKLVAALKLLNGEFTPRTLNDYQPPAKCPADED